MANIILFLGVADDPKVVGKLKCDVWFPLHTKAIGHWTLSGHPNRYEVKYFLRYLCYIHIIRFFFIISKFPYVYHYRSINFGLVVIVNVVIVNAKKTEPGLRKLTTPLRKGDTP